MRRTSTLTVLSRAERARIDLLAVVAHLRTDEFERVHAGRWRHRRSKLHVETGYSYGEGVVRLYANGDRTMTDRILLRGSTGEIDKFARAISQVQ